MSDATASPPPPPAESTRIGLWPLFLIFLRGGGAFGGGTGIAAMLQDELVQRRRAIARADFLTIYALSRIVPSGTVSALAVAFGHRFQGLRGSFVALLAMILPSFVLTLLFTIAYEQLAGTPVFAVLQASVLPAAFATMVVGALQLGREFARPSVELVLMVGVFLGAVVLQLDAPFMLIGGGLIAALLGHLSGRRA